MKTIFIFVCVAALSVFTDVCGDSSQGEPLKESSKNYVRENLDYKTDLNGKRIAVEGYMYVEDTTEQEGSKISLVLYTKPKGEGDRLVKFQTETGDSKNTIALPELKNGKIAPGFNTKEFKIDADKIMFYDNESVSHPITDKVRVSANLEYIKTFNDEISHITDPLNKSKELYMFYLKNSRFDAIAK